MIAIEIPMDTINLLEYKPMSEVAPEDMWFEVLQPTYEQEEQFSNLETAPTYQQQLLYDQVMDDLVEEETIPKRGNYDIKAAIDTIHKNVKINLQTGKPKDETKYTHWCAKSVRLALQQGGLDMSGRPNYGGQYGPYLLSKGWVALPKGSKPEAGDVAVTIPHGSKKGGHIALFDGKDWYSDAKQRSMYVYRTANDNNTTIYRYAG